MPETPDPVAFIHQALGTVAPRPEDASDQDVARLAAIARGLNRRTIQATEELAAIQVDMLPLAERVGRCREANQLLKSYLRRALRARAAAADTTVGARRYTALADSVGGQSAAGDLRVALAHDSHSPNPPTEDAR